MQSNLNAITLFFKERVSCSVDLLIVEALEIAANNAAPPVGFSFDRWKLPLL